ncbi:hypothetical protein [Nocardioides sp. MH1]|uniref:hypothetical protein n=1 Tax=Nocardioides sp. MH1 TaxID=3242490 RepID=UPI0035206C23
MGPLRLLPVLLLALAPGLAACGDDDGESSTPTTDAASATSSPSHASTTPTGSTPGVPRIPPACDVLDPGDLQAAYGVAFGPAEQGGGGHSEGTYEWQSDDCSFTAEALLEVQLELVGPDDFSGEFACPPPSEIAASVESVDGLGDRAWWKKQDGTPLSASLRVCTPDYDFDITLDYEDGVDYVGDPETQTIALAGVVLAALA